MALRRTKPGPVVGLTLWRCEHAFCPIYTDSYAYSGLDRRLHKRAKGLHLSTIVNVASLFFLTSFKRFDYRQILFFFFSFLFFLFALQKTESCANANEFQKLKRKETRGCDDAINF